MNVATFNTCFFFISNNLPCIYSNHTHMMHSHPLHIAKIHSHMVRWWNRKSEIESETKSRIKSRSSKQFSHKLKTLHFVVKIKHGMREKSVVAAISLSARTSLNSQPLFVGVKFVTLFPLSIAASEQKSLFGVCVYVSRLLLLLSKCGANT